MKTAGIFKIFAVIFCSIVFASAIQAQEKPQTVMFYSFESEDRNNSTLIKKKLSEFLNQLSKEPKTTKGFINIAGNSRLAEKIKSFITANSNLIDRIVFNHNLKYPERPSSFFDFYIIQQGAEIPYIIVNEPIVCPIFTVTARKEKIGREIFVTFTAKSKVEDLQDVIYEWTISAGKIVEGQGTAKIKVAAKNAKEITSVIGLGGEFDVCESNFSETVEIRK